MSRSTVGCNNLKPVPFHIEGVAISGEEKGDTVMGESELTVEYKGGSDPDLDAALRAALKPFGYELLDKGYDQKSRVRDLRFQKEA